MPLYDLKLQFLCDVHAYVTLPVPVGPAAWGTRLIFPVVGGTVKGPRINGKIRPFGADWAIIRADNCLELDVRALVDTDDGAVIHAEYRGIIDMTKEQVERFLSGELVEGQEIYTTPRVETCHEKYSWLNRVQVVARGGVEPEGDKLRVSYSWYALTS